MNTESSFFQRVDACESVLFLRDIAFGGSVRVVGKPEARAEQRVMESQMETQNTAPNPNHCTYKPRAIS